MSAPFTLSQAPAKPDAPRGRFVCLLLSLPPSRAPVKPVAPLEGGFCVCLPHYLPRMPWRAISVCLPLSLPHELRSSRATEGDISVSAPLARRDKRTSEEGGRRQRLTAEKDSRERDPPQAVEYNPLGATCAALFPPCLPASKTTLLLTVTIGFACLGVIRDVGREATMDREMEGRDGRTV